MNTPIYYILKDSSNGQEYATAEIKTLQFKDLPTIKHTDVAFNVITINAEKIILL